MTAAHSVLLLLLLLNLAASSAVAASPDMWTKFCARPPERWLLEQIASTVLVLGLLWWGAA